MSDRADAGADPGVDAGFETRAGAVSAADAEPDRPAPSRPHGADAIPDLRLTGPTLLQLLALASPALPVGGFSYSEGLEAAVDAGTVVDEASAGDWLLAQLALQLARADLPALAAAHDAWSRDDRAAVDDVADWLHETRETAEGRAQALQMGRSLLQWLRNGPHAADPRLRALAPPALAPPWPVAFALAAVLAGAAAPATLLVFAWSWAENQVQAATKAVPLGQAAAQRVLARLQQAIPAAVDTARALPRARWQSSAPMLAIAGARHEAQYSRLFRS